MATQEILDELRPKICPIDWNFGHIIKMFKLFLPVKLPPDLHNQGFKFVYFLSLSSLVFIICLSSDYGSLSFSVYGKVFTIKQSVKMLVFFY